MVFTLHRYIFRELLKVFVPAALALTVMLSLGIILRPVQEYGVGPRQVIHLIGYFLPVTLTFVLPIAALFAASLVYGRFASDNELDACRASGISLLTLVYPGLALAIMVAIANLILSFHVMPAFVHRAEKSLKADAKQILFRNIQRRGYYRLPPDERHLIYADLADPHSDTLSGVVVVEVEGGTIEKITTAESARVLFNPRIRFNEVQITAHNTYQMSAEDEGSAEWLLLTAEFGSLLGDDIKFKKLDEMKKIRDVDPMLFDPIAKLARRAFAQLSAELLAQDISNKMSGASESGSAPNVIGGFYKLYSGRRFVEFTTSHCRTRGEREVELSGDVVVIESDLDNKQVMRTLQCARALLHIEGDELSPTLTMELRNPAWQRPDGATGPAAGWVRIRGLILPRAVQTATNEFRTESSLKAVKLGSEVSVLKEGSGPKLKDLQRRLERKIRRTLAEIEAETHSRLVFGIGCVSMIMIGMGLGIILRGGHLLTAFGVSCVPAAVLMVCILMGKNVAKNLGSQAVSGTVLMWTGLVFLSLMAVVIYHKLLKN
jgi:lipopolysaccharide export LptBFGC system permease protein LptF